MAVTDPVTGRQWHPAFVVHVDDEGSTGRRRRSGSSASRPAHRGAATFENCIPGDRVIGEPPVPVFQDGAGDPDHTWPTIGAQAVGIIAQGALDAAIALHPRDRKAVRPRSLTTRVQFMLADMAMEGEAARLMV